MSDPERINEKKYVIAIILIGALAIFLRFWRLDSIPFGLHVDEVSMAYDAYCLGNYGVARDLTSFPVYLSNYSGGQNVLSSYITSIFITLFGTGTIVIRLPGVLFSFVTIVCGSLIVKEGLGKCAGIIAAILLTILPYFITSARFGLESYLLTGTSTLMLLLLILAIKHQKYWLFALAGLSMALSLYSYAVSYVIMPLFLLGALIYLFYVRKIKLSQIFAFGIPLLIFAMPLILFVIVNQFGLSSIKIGSLTIPNLSGYRGGDIGIRYILGNLWTVFRVMFFRDPLPYNAFDYHYTLYTISIPFVLIGIYKGIKIAYTSFRDRNYNPSSIILIFWMSATLMALMIGVDPPNVNKINAVYFSCGNHHCLSYAKPQPCFCLAYYCHICNEFSSFRTLVFFSLFKERISTDSFLSSTGSSGGVGLTP